MSFADGMKEKRKMRRLSQTDLSRISGVPQSTISAVESKGRVPTEDTMVGIAKGLNCTVGELLGETKKDPADNVSGVKSDITFLLDRLPESYHPELLRYIEFLIANHAQEEAPQRSDRPKG